MSPCKSYSTQDLNYGKSRHLLKSNLSIKKTGSKTEDETLFYKIYCKTQTHLDPEHNTLTLNETQETVLSLVSQDDLPILNTSSR